MLGPPTWLEGSWVKLIHLCGPLACPSISLLDLELHLLLDPVSGYWVVLHEVWAFSKLYVVNWGFVDPSEYFGSVAGSRLDSEDMSVILGVVRGFFLVVNTRLLSRMNSTIFSLLWSPSEVRLYLICIRLCHMLKSDDWYIAGSVIWSSRMRNFLSINLSWCGQVDPVNKDMFADLLYLLLYARLEEIPNLLVSAL